ncbi:hypothetical protein GCM10027425_33470 [Alteromonas gracilis]
MSEERTPMKSAGLPGSRTARLPKPSRAPNTPRPPAAAESTSTKPATKQAPQQAPAPASKASERAVTVVPISLSLPVEVVQRLRERAAQDRISQAEVLLDAIEAAGEELPGLVEDLQSGRQPPSATTSGPFVRRARETRASAPQATVSLRLDSRNLAAIDKLARRHGDRARSLLCTAALRHYLIG